MKKYNTEEERLMAYRLQQKEYYERNKELVKERSKKRYKENIELIREQQKIYNKEYIENNKEIIKEKRNLKKEENNLRAKIYHEKNKELINKKNNEYRKNNEEKIKIIKQNHYLANKEIINLKSQEYYKNNKKEINTKNYIYQKNKRQTDPIYNLKCRVRNIIYKAIKKNGFNKKSKTEEILGCSFEEFNIHLESLWKPWMNWGNYGLYNGTKDYGWDIDHIIPLATTITEEGVIKLNHYTNLQPLCSKINRDIKRDNI
jgi:hypothetical protein